MPVDVMQVEGDAGEIRVPGSADTCLSAPLRLNEDMMKAYNMNLVPLLQVWLLGVYSTTMLFGANIYPSQGTMFGK
jgi:hypothetical protein